jgi:hypothetical protein
MYLCYIDESGTPEIPGNTSHFVLAGLSMPIWHWRDADRDISSILARYGLDDQEFHTAWIRRAYLEQARISGFDNMDRPARRAAVARIRTAELLRLQRLQNSKAYKQAKKNYRNSDAYIHLSYSERISLIREVAEQVAGWGFARLFAEAIDKVHFDPARTRRSVDEQAFEQIIARFQQYLVNTQETPDRRSYGVVVHDNNQSVAKKHTDLMRSFHAGGTLWTRVDRIIETPLFVDSKLTRMVQIADLCSVAIRRYVENGETEIFRLIFARGDRIGPRVVGVRHFTDRNLCLCEICKAHNAPSNNAN